MPSPQTYQPGDVLFFSGSDPVSRFIQAVTLPAWTSVVTVLMLLAPLLNVVRPEKYPAVNPWYSTSAAICWWVGAFAWSPKISHVGVIAEYKGTPLLFESTSLCDLPCVIKGQIVKGVQAHDPKGARVTEYRGRVYVMRLTEDRTLEAAESALLTKLVLSRLGQPYNTLGAVVSGTRFTKWFWTPRASAAGYCSQLSMYWLKCVGRVADDVRSPRVNPNGSWRILYVGEFYQEPWMVVV